MHERSGEFIDAPTSVPKTACRTELFRTTFPPGSTSG